jgi:hypothetical protein
LILRASNKVNGARPFECATAFLDALTRYVDNIRVEFNTSAPANSGSSKEEIAPGNNVCFDRAQNDYPDRGTKQKDES